MKKAILVAVALMVVIAFAACGNDDNDSDNRPTAEQAIDEPVVSTPPTDSEEVMGEDYPTVTADLAGGPDFSDLEAWLDYHFPATDLGGITLRVNGFGNPYHENPVYAARYQERRERVERRFNVNLEFLEDIVAVAGAWGDVPDVIMASVAAGDPLVHLFRGNTGYWFPSLANGGYLVNMDAYVRANFPSNYYYSVGEAGDGTIYGFSNTPPYAWNVMVYNRDMIRAIGMEYTPSEMFMAGRWSLDDFYEYLVELNRLLPAETIPLGMHPQWWWRMATYANGGYILNPRTSAPGLLLDETLEPLDFLQRLVQDGLFQQPTFFSEEDGSSIPGGNWSWGDQFIGGSWGDLFREGRFAISNSAPWGFEDLGTHFEFGIIPPPWGSNVTFPGDWRDLKTHTPYKSVFNDATTAMMVRGTPEIVTPEVFVNILYTFYTDDGLRLIENRELLGEGGILRLNSSNHLFTPEDVALWEWYASNSTWEGMDSGGFWDISVHNAWLNTLGGTGDFRSAFEAIMPSMVWRLYDFGRLQRENIPEAMWIQASEFGATMGDE